MLLEIAFGSDVVYILSIVFYGSFKKQMVSRVATLTTQLR